MKRWIILLLAFLLLPATALAAVADIPQIDPAAAGIQARPIASETDAIAYAKALWTSDYLLEDFDGLVWQAEFESGEYVVTAAENADGPALLTARFGSDGAVTYLYNGVPRFECCFEGGTYDGQGEAALRDYLLGFADALSPGASAALGNLEAQADMVVFETRSFVTFLCYSDAGDTVTIFTVEIDPQVRVVDYLPDYPVITPGDFG